MALKAHLRDLRRKGKNRVDARKWREKQVGILDELRDETQRLKQ